VLHATDSKKGSWRHGHKVHLDAAGQALIRIAPGNRRQGANRRLSPERPFLGPKARPPLPGRAQAPSRPGLPPCKLLIAESLIPTSFSPTSPAGFFSLSCSWLCGER